MSFPEKYVQICQIGLAAMWEGEFAKPLSAILEALKGMRKRTKLTHPLTHTQKSPKFINNNSCL
jgi:hypothetical protein